MSNSAVPQNADMKAARSQIQFSVDLLREFLHGQSVYPSALIVPLSYSKFDLTGSHDEWEKHARLVTVLSQDPVFDKTDRYIVLTHAM